MVYLIKQFVVIRSYCSSYPVKLSGTRCKQLVLDCTTQFIYQSFSL